MDDWYWGGYTGHGELLHLVTTSKHGQPRSACGLVLQDAWDIPELLRGARCRRCVVSEQKAERDELKEVGRPL